MSQRLAKERLGRCDATIWPEQRLDRLAVLIDRSVQVGLFWPCPNKRPSTRHDELAGLALRFQRRAYSGTNRMTHRITEVW